MRSPASPEATFRGAAISAVSLASALSAHMFAMREHSPASSASAMEMSGHHMMADHHMGSMPGMAGSATPSISSSAISTAPSLLSIVLLAAVSVGFGAVASRPRVLGAAATSTLVLAGQGLGHLTLGLTMGHVALTPAMSLAHCAAAGVVGFAIAYAAAAMRLAAGSLREVRPLRADTSDSAQVRTWVFYPTRQSVIACHAALRAPPG